MVEDQLTAILEILKVILKYIIIGFLGVGAILVVIGNTFYSKALSEKNAHGL